MHGYAPWLSYFQLASKVGLDGGSWSRFCLRSRTGQEGLDGAHGVTGDWVVVIALDWLHKQLMASEAPAAGLQHIAAPG